MRLELTARLLRSCLSDFMQPYLTAKITREFEEILVPELKYHQVLEIKFSGKVHLVTVYKSSFPYCFLISTPSSSSSIMNFSATFIIKNAVSLCCFCVLLCFATKSLNIDQTKTDKIYINML